MKFFEGGFWYNLAALVFGILGLGLALWQIARVQASADAARDAARETKGQLKAFSGYVDVGRAARFSMEVLSLLRSKDTRGAAVRASDLRESMAMVRVSLGGQPLLRAAEWQSLMTKIGSLHEALEKAAPQSAALLITAAASIHQDIVSLHQRAAENTGAR